MRKELVAITIPIYKQTVNDAELTSLNQCIKILSHYPVVFFAPESLNTAFYEHHCTGKITYIIKRFDDRYFNGITGYNQLMLSKDFYYAFINFKYILIYQLDAFVFRDELEMWCNKGYDFIGAPVINFNISKNQQATDGMKFLSRYKYVYKVLNFLHISDYKFRHVENGGFSLRKVSSFVLLLTILKKQAQQWPINEDTFFTYWFNILFFFFKLPEEMVALNFSFEQNPRKSFVLNNSKLPFGCHAFKRYEPDFWKNHLPK